VTDGSALALIGAKGVRSMFRETQEQDQGDLLAIDSRLETIASEVAEWNNRCDSAIVLSKHGEAIEIWKKSRAKRLLVEMEIKRLVAPMPIKTTDWMKSEPARPPLPWLQWRLKGVAPDASSRRRALWFQARSLSDRLHQQAGALFLYRIAAEVFSGVPRPFNVSPTAAIARVVNDDDPPIPSAGGVDGVNREFAYMLGIRDIGNNSEYWDFIEVLRDHDEKARHLGQNRYRTSDECMSVCNWAKPTASSLRTMIRKLAALKMVDVKRSDEAWCEIALGPAARHFFDIIHDPAHTDIMTVIERLLDDGAG
jgi:hypothetical protein